VFIGHYAVCFAIKRYEKKTSLGKLFIAVQCLDLLFFSLVIAGIEKFSLQEHYMAASHLKIEYFPWSHSVVAAIIWSLFAYCIFMYLIPIRGSRANKVAVLMALAVFSHWVLDFLVHAPDLPVLGENSPKLGLGLWNYSITSWLLEAGILIAAFALYIRKTRVRRKKGRHAMLVLLVIMLLVGALNTFGPVHVAAKGFSITAIVSFLVLAWLAARFEQYRA